MKVGGQLVGIASRLPASGSQEPNSHNQAWQLEVFNFMPPPPHAPPPPKAFTLYKQSPLRLWLRRSSLAADLDPAKGTRPQPSSLGGEMRGKKKWILGVSKEREMS